jgi:hypothetical protein
MTGELTGVILSALIFKPSLLESSDICADDFPAGLRRKVFSIIVKIWEDERPGEIDQTILAAQLDKDEAAYFYAEIMGGRIRLEPEIFRRRVLELRKKAIQKRLASRLKRELDILEKTGDLSLASVFSDLDEYRAIENSGLKIQPLSSIEPQEIKWLWRGRIPFGMLSLIAGAPEVGKSFLSIFIASRLSKGEALPDSAEPIKCDSLFLVAEDPLAQAVRPRFDANGGDPTRIFVLEEGTSDFGEVLARLRQAVKENPEIRFVILDPLNSFLKSGVDNFRDPDIRRNLLRPLSDLGEETGTAVVGICHPRKEENSSALNRIAGSIAFGAAARSVLGIGLDPEDENRRILAAIKSNYCQRPPSLGFRIGADLRIIFDGKPVDRDAESIFSRPDPEAAADHNYACKWLREALKDGPIDFKDLRTAAEEAGILKDSLYRVQKRLGIIPIPSGFGKFKHSTWGLPK